MSPKDHLVFELQKTPKTKPMFDIKLSKLKTVILL